MTDKKKNSSIVTASIKEVSNKPIDLTVGNENPIDPKKEDKEEENAQVSGS